MEHILTPLQPPQTTSAGSRGLSSPGIVQVCEAALPEVRIPLEALLHKVMEAGGEGPKVRVQGWLPIGCSHVADSHVLTHPIICTRTGGLHGQLISRNCGGVEQAGNSSIQLLQEHLE